MAFDPAAPPVGFTTGLWLKNGTGLFQDTPGTVPAALGDLVGRWSDQIGTRHFIQATSANKGLRTALGVSFDGVSDLLQCATGLVYPGEYAVCCRVRRLSGAGSVFLAENDSGGPVPRQWLMPMANATTLGFQCFRADLGANAADTEPVVANAWLNSVMIRRAADCQTYVDGVSNGATAIAAGNAVNSTAFALGARNGTGWAHCEFAEFFIVQGGTFDAAIIADLTAYLNTVGAVGGGGSILGPFGFF